MLRLLIILILSVYVTSITEYHEDYKCKKDGVEGVLMVKQLDNLPEVKQSYYTVHKDFMLASMDPPLTTSTIFLYNFTDKSFRPYIGSGGAHESGDGIGLNGHIQYQYTSPEGAFFHNDKIYFRDKYMIREFDTVTKSLTSVAGDSVSGDVDGVGLAAKIGSFYDSITDGTYAYFFHGFKLRKMDLNTYEITTIAGDGTNADVDGTGTAAQIRSVKGYCLDGDDLYLLSYYNNLRKINLNTLEVTTIVADFLTEYPNIIENEPKRILKKEGDDLILQFSSRIIKFNVVTKTFGVKIVGEKERSTSSDRVQENAIYRLSNNRFYLPEKAFMCEDGSIVYNRVIFDCITEYPIIKLESGGGGSQGPAGADGAQGPAGPQGPAGSGGSDITLGSIASLDESILWIVGGIAIVATILGAIALIMKGPVGPVGTDVENKPLLTQVRVERELMQF